MAKKILKSELINNFLTLKRIKFFDSISEPEVIAYEHFIKFSSITCSFTYFKRLYGLASIRFSKFRRMCSVSNLKNGTHFSFKRNGQIFVAHDRFIRPGKSEYEMSLHYFGTVNKRYFHGHIKYKLSKAQSRLVYLHDLNNMASTKIDEIKVLYK